uniref:Uncharacterized protein n=1 Tax=Anguilla anguilla TaxID=7936 RepID=A0A0E9V0K5_ANGAN
MFHCNNCFVAQSSSSPMECISGILWHKTYSKCR